MAEISIPEQRVCERLGPLLREHSVGESLGDQLTAGDLMVSFEWFLPEVLREVHAEWRGEALDGIYPRFFRKIGDREAELLGLAIFISDQTLTPIHFCIQLSPNFDFVSWIELRLGEHTGTGCRREPYGSSKAQGTMLHVAERFDSIDWFYHVGYGERDA
ncbi:hypothetical protein [Aeoliella sp. SH292]|uniref:hypothetical protein n=1 Tax=Aeoliella sp. SH292 TaxID=3454464 RepID=UPI003F95A9CE